ncbi:hypothetical protein V2J09_013495 [Rumex salicifolius]
MGKPIGKKKPHQEASSNSKPAKNPSNSKALDDDTAVFVAMSNELKEEGNKLFQRRDFENAMLRFEKALKLLPKTHIDVASLRTSMASCYMQMGIGEFPRAINECNLALEVAPKYSKALLRRAKCFEALNRFDLAWKDVSFVLSMEPSNLVALEIRDSIKKAIDEKGIELDCQSELGNGKNPNLRKSVKGKKLIKEKLKSKKKKKVVSRIEGSEKSSSMEDDDDEEDVDEIKSKLEDKEVVEEKKISIKEETLVTRTMKLVYGDDIRWAELPNNCSLLLMRDIVLDRFPNLKGVLIKYKDQEGDYVTITTTQELRSAVQSSSSGGSIRFYVAQVSPDQEPKYSDGVVVVDDGDDHKKKIDDANAQDQDVKSSTCIDTWILQFAELFKNHVGFDSGSYLDLHDVGMKLYSEAIEEVVSTQEAQGLFNSASESFQEMAALALFNCGNVHMSKARMQVLTSEDDQEGSIKAAYDWSCKEYKNAAMRYEEALQIKPDFYEGRLALGQQQFEQAKLCWTYQNIGSETLELFNKAEDNMEVGMQFWEEMEERRLNGISKEQNYKPKLVGEEALEQAKIMRSQILILWGSLLYERSIVEFKLGLPTWEECLEVAVEKFELAGASKTDVAVMVKNHCAHKTAQEGLGFKIDEIVQAWHEMYDAKRWLLGVPSFRLEPLFRRRVSSLQNALECHV